MLRLQAQTHRGRPSPTRAEHVEEDLGDAIDMILDGGQVGIGLGIYDRRFYRGYSGEC